MTSGRIVGLNGQLVSEEAARVSVFDHGFLYGAGFFATMRWQRGKVVGDQEQEQKMNIINEPNGYVFLWEWQMERLQRSCTSLGIDWSAEGMLANVAAVCRANGLFDQAYVRISVSAGEAPLGLFSGTYQKPQTIVIAQPLAEPLLKPMTQRQAKVLQVVSIPRSGLEGEERFKSFQYLNLLNGKRALMAGGNVASDVEGLMLDAHGSVCEGLVSNLFFRCGSTWFTPALQTGCLPGVTRRWVLAYLREQGIAVQEGHFSVSKVSEADEVLMTNAIQQIVAIRQLNDVDGNVLRVWDAPGEMVQALMSAFERASRL